MALRSPNAATGQAQAQLAIPACVGGRYDVESLLGRGGMALVYRVSDRTTGRTLALKWLDMRSDAEHVRRMTALFEREYHTLQQLSHPRVVECHEYGLHEHNPYYTMELLDGGDLRELAPLPWREVCRVAYDACSALSLLHSRRLVHLDVTPRNIRRTADGKAKLIDFGLLSPMGVRALAAGTPAFLAPEVIGNVTVDGRADLFSLGATLYYALTGRNAYPAQHLQALQDAWRSSPVAPSRLASDVPPAVDALILSMIRVDAGSRPKSAAEVMEKLLPLVAADAGELPRITQAYLTTPQLVGREPIIERFRKLLVRALGQRGGGFVISGKPGVGRSRLLDAFALEAKLAGAISLRASGLDARLGRFGVAAALARQLLVALPEIADSALSFDPSLAVLLERGAGAFCVADLASPLRDRTAVHSALQSLFLHASERRSLALAIDDYHEWDEASSAWIASMAGEAATHRLAYALTIDADASLEAEDTRGVLLSVAECLELTPLEPEQLTRLLCSVFGDVAHLSLLSSRLYPLCAGRPRECMALAQQLVDHGVIHYANGSWCLPESYAAGVLPATLEEALERQIAQLSAAAQRTAALLALGVLRSLGRAQLPGPALDELLAAQLVTGDEGAYTLCHDELARRILARSDAQVRRELHDALVRMYEEARAEPLAIAYHSLSGNTPLRGLRLVLDLAPDPAAWEAVLDRAQLQLSVDQIGKALELALREGERAAISERELLALRERLAHQTTLGQDPAYYYAVAPACLAVYKRDSGFDDWHALDPALPAKVRTEQALARAFERWQRTPEAERVLSPGDAIKALVRWVAISLPIASRIGDLNLTASLSELLPPFAGISTIADVIARNALAARVLRCEARTSDARDIWLGVVRELEASTDADVPYRTRMLMTIYCVIGTTEATLGIESDWSERIEQREHDAGQLAQVYSVRRLAALSAGDWEAAEHERKRAEAIRLRTRAHQVISTLGPELLMHAAARDLTGVKQLRSDIHAMAQKFPGWLPIQHLADAYYARSCGDLEGALGSAERAIAEAEQQFPRWNALPAAHVAKVELLVELDRGEVALAYALPLLERYRTSGVDHSRRELSRAIALAEAKCRRFEAAWARVEDVVREQLALGISRLQLGLSYETGARIAVLARDAERFEHYSEHTAEHFRPGSSVLGALYERLQEEARAAGLIACAPLPAVTTSGAPVSASEALTRRVAAVMRACQSSRERAHAALVLLCDGRRSRGGMLFLLTEAGLTLSASTLDGVANSEIEAHAQRYLSAELARLEEADGQTRTFADLAAQPELSARAPWQSPDGLPCTPVLLSSVQHGRLCVAGLALLREPEESDRTLAGLTAALTEYLAADGETKPARFGDGSSRSSQP